jgi:hypothetical protein
MKPKQSAKATAPQSNRASKPASDVFDRLFRSAAKDKTRLTTKVKQQIAKKVTELRASSPQHRHSMENSSGVLRENKRLANHTKDDTREARNDSLSSSAQEFVLITFTKVYLKDPRTNGQKRFSCYKDKDLNICSDVSKKIVKVVGEMII